MGNRLIHPVNDVATCFSPNHIQIFQITAYLAVTIAKKVGKLFCG